MKNWSVLQAASGEGVNAETMQPRQATCTDSADLTPGHPPCLPHDHHKVALKSQLESYDT